MMCSEFRLLQLILFILAVVEASELRDLGERAAEW